MEKYHGVLYYRNKKSKYRGALKGSPGMGFKLTNDGNYDIENKKLVNVNEPEHDKDVLIYSFFVKSMNKFIENLADVNTRLELLTTDIDDRGEYMEEVKRSVRLNTAALEAFKNEQKILNDFVRVYVYNKVFIGVASNILLTNKKFIEFEKVILSNNIKILNVNDQKILFFANEGYYRITIQFFCSIKLDLYISIMLNRRKEKNPIVHKKLTS